MSFLSSKAKSIAGANVGARYAVITADIVKSRSIEDFRSNGTARSSPLEVSPQPRFHPFEYTITAWDEFEAIAARLVDVPAILLDLRRRFYPIRLQIAVGIGELSDIGEPVNAFAGGIAFERARDALIRLKAEQTTMARSSLFVSDNEEFDSIANTVYHLHDTLVRGITLKQWMTIDIQLNAQSQEPATKLLGIGKPAVSRRLKRGFYWQIVETRKAMTKLIEYFSGDDASRQQTSP